MNNKTFLFILIPSIFIILFCNSVLSFNALTIKNVSSNKIIFQEHIKTGEKFLLKYTHSVAKTPVWEFFEFNTNEQLYLIETHFLDHGAGLPYTSFEGETFISEGGRFKIKNMSRKITLPLYYRIGKIRENYLIFKDKGLNLSKMVGDSLVKIDIIKINLLQFIYRKYFN